MSYKCFNPQSLFPLVAALDPRCLKYYFWTPLATTTFVPTAVCTAATNINGVKTCVKFAYEFTDSIFAYEFEYSGEQCVSAALETYAPVVFGSLTLTSLVKATAELLVPRFHRWAVSPQNSWVRARRLVRWLIEMAFAVPMLNGEWRAPEEDDQGMNEVQSLVEGAFRDLMGIIPAALTFGLAVPVVAAAATISACCTALHTTFLLAKLADRFPDGEAPPKLRGCCDTPKGLGVAIVAFALSVWALAMCGQFDDDMGYVAVAAGFGAGVGGALVVAGLCRLCATVAATADESETPKDIELTSARRAPCLQCGSLIQPGTGGNSNFCGPCMAGTTNVTTTTTNVTTTTASPSYRAEMPSHSASKISSWKELRDEASGNVYYYNSVTGETTWDRPVELSDVAADLATPAESTILATPELADAGQSTQICAYTRTKARRFCYTHTHMYIYICVALIEHT